MAKKPQRIGHIDIPENITIPPAEDVSVLPQTKILDVPSGEVINPPYKEQEPIYKVRVTHPSLRRRKGPDMSAEVVGLITDQGMYEIYSEHFGWGELKDHTWISLQFTTKIK